MDRPPANLSWTSAARRFIPARIGLLAVLALTLSARTFGAPSGQIAGGPPFDCNLVVGTWYSETYNPKEKYTNKSRARFELDGTLALDFELVWDDGTTERPPMRTRTWFCDGFLYLTRNDPRLEPGASGPRFKVYELLEVSQTRLIYRTLIGHSPGVVFRLERVDPVPR